MTDELTSLPSWVPTPKQRRAIEMLAAGYSALRTSEVIEVDYKTLWRWKQKPEFTALVASVRYELVKAQRPLYDNSISIAQDIYTRALTGEHSDRRTLELATKLLESTLWRAAKPRAALDEASESDTNSA